MNRNLLTYQLHVFGPVHVPLFEHVGEQIGVVHVAPVHPVVHVQVLGAEQVPPFWQGLVQFATAHVAPYQPVIHWQVLGAVQLPLTHGGIQATIN